ncbi:hypothetical protein AOLI_G00113610 [Acnodon oligacanthus]
MGIYEYNRLPQGLCNNPGSFMRMMTNIFGDQNFLGLLCCLDDLLVYAPTEVLALEHLELVFSRLHLHNLKLAPKKCWLLRRAVKFLGHIVDESGVSTDSRKVDAISQMCTSDLMEHDGITISPSRIRSFLGMINFYQHFIPSYSATAKPLFGLVVGQKQKQMGCKVGLYEFDIKYIPGPRNIVADTLSRKPIVKLMIGQRILKDPYDELLRETVPVSTNSVQDAFRCSSYPTVWAPTCAKNHSLSREVVSAILETHSVWDSGARARATNILHHLPQMISSDADIIPYSERELREAQLTDPVLSRVLHYVNRGRRPRSVI